jgi:hypothetical protein
MPWWRQWPSYLQRTNSPLTRFLSGWNAPLLESLIELRPWRLEHQQRIKTSFSMTLVRTTMMRRTRWRRWRSRSPSTLHHVPHHDDNTAMTNGCTKSLHALRVDQIGRVWEATLIVALINSTFAVVMILLLKLSLRFLHSMVCMTLKLIWIRRWQLITNLVPILFLNNIMLDRPLLSLRILLLSGGTNCLPFIYNLIHEIG